MFIISQSYDRDELLDFVGSKQNQSGIIWGNKEPSCIIITAGGRGGKSLGYSDEKNRDGSLFYIGQGSKGDQDPTRFSNSLLVNGEKTVLFFSTREPNAEEVRQRNNHRKLYTFEGIFEVVSWNFYVPTEGKRKGDKLLRFLLVPANSVYDTHADLGKLEPSISQVNLFNLRKKVKSTNPKPTKGTSSAKEYFKRSRDIIIYTRLRANGICEYCNKKAPFLDAENNPFLEVHHIFRLADDGPDTPENVAAICPNCHREAHYGINKNNIKTKLGEMIKLKEEKFEKSA